MANSYSKVDKKGMKHVFDLNAYSYYYREHQSASIYYIKCESDGKKCVKLNAKEFITALCKYLK